jgi:hypothetical protein
VPTQDGSGWVTPDHPLAWKAPTGATAPAAGTGTPGATPGSALGGPAEAAKSGMFTQYAPMEHDFQNWQQLELVSNLLANPETLDAQTVQAMKQKAQEDAMFRQREADEAAAAELGASGFGFNGGRADAQRRASSEGLESAILGSNRDLDIMATQQNRNDQLNALQAAEGILGGQVGRSSSTFQDILRGQQANRDDHWTGEQLALQRLLGEKGIGVDMARISSGDRQFDARLGEDVRQFNNQMGFNWAGLNANQQGDMMNRILGILG